MMALPADALPLPVICSDKGGRVVYANPPATAFFGNELVGKRVLELYGSSRKHAVREARRVRRALESSPDGSLLEMIVSVRRWDQTLRTVAASYSGLADGGVVAVISERSGELLTSIRQITEDLVGGAPSDKTLRAVAEQAGRLVDADRAYVKLYEAPGKLVISAIWPPDEGYLGDGAPLGRGMTGKVFEPPHDPILSNDVLKEPPERYFPLFSDTRSKMVVPLIYARPDGEVIDLECLGVLAVDSTRPHAFSNDQVELLETLASHATLALMLSEDLQASAEAYQKLAESVREAFGQMAAPRYIHEAENTLQSVADTLEDVVRGLESPRAKKKDLIQMVEELREPAKEMSLILRDELDRMKEERTIEERGPIDLARVARRASTVAGLAHRGITVTFHNELATAPEVYASEDAVLIVLLNLLSNSSKGIRSERPEGTIQILIPQKQPSTARWRILVSDDGPGINRSTMRDLRERLRHGSFSPGQGYGLIQVKQIVDSLDGRLDIRTSYDGVTVAVEFPRA